MFKKVDPKQDFVKLEHEIIKFWDEHQIIDKYLSKNDESNKIWSFLDGPITANNPMGVHHGWGRTLKDLWQRFYTLKGYKQRYQNGFDCQGLWVEVEVEKALDFKSKKDIEGYGIDKFVNLCKERVLKYSDVITKQSQRLAEWMHWDDSYYTMSEENNYTIWHFLKVCYEKGWIYEGTDSVPWCPRCGTAISQHEILTEEYKVLTHDAVFFLLPITNGEYKNYNLLVWTTTPWTIPANVAVAVDVKKEYGVYEVSGKKVIVLKKRADKVLGKDKKFIKEFLGEELIDLNYEMPFSDIEGLVKQKEGYNHKIVASDEMLLPISEDDGTGLVHIAPGAGSEDFQLGKKYQLPIVSVIDESANYLEDLGFLSGKNAKNNPEIIFNFLKEKDNGKFLFKIEPYKHRYPTCWRCKTELVWRNVNEWYIAMDKKDPKDGKTFREKMIEVTKKINWMPSWGLERELDWLNNMHDWLISKKRYWGLALPIYKCHKCGKFEVLGSREELKERACFGWDKFEGNTPHRPWVDEVKIKCSSCGETTERIKDVGNPWLDAGIVPFSTIKDPKTNKVSYLDDKKYWNQWYPVDFITECFPGQFKNWFYALIAMSTALENEAPFKNLLGHALVKDEHGREMHKSSGNAIWFDDAAEEMGVDVIRWMYCGQNPVQNLNFGYGPAKEILRRFILTLWNTYSFFITYANVDGWKIGETGNKTILDKWILARLEQTKNKVHENLKKYNSYHATTSIEEFVDDLSKWYLRLSRKRRDKAFYATMYEVLKELTIVTSMFMPHLSENIYQNLRDEKDPISVHLADWPKQKEINQNILDDMEKIRKYVEVAHSLRKEAKLKVRQPLKNIVISNFYKFDQELIEIIKLEVNVKEVIDKKLENDRYLEREEAGVFIGLDLEITPELEEEGLLRELIRQIQFMRKKSGLFANAKMDLVLSTEDKRLLEIIKSNEKMIKESTLSNTLTIIDDKEINEKDIVNKVGDKKVYIAIK